jgi:hypothetical protein
VLAAFIVIVAASLGTVLYDASYALKCASQADSYAAEAARAAASAVGPVPTGGGGDATRAAAAASAYLSRTNVSSFHITVTGPATVRVTVTVAGSSPLLHVGVSQTRTHTAVLQVGVERGEDVP